MNLEGWIYRGRGLWKCAEKKKEGGYFGQINGCREVKRGGDGEAEGWKENHGEGGWVRL